MNILNFKIAIKNSKDNSPRMIILFVIFPFCLLTPLADRWQKVNTFLVLYIYGKTFSSITPFWTLRNKISKVNRINDTWYETQLLKKTIKKKTEMKKVFTLILLCNSSDNIVF